MRMNGAYSHLLGAIWVSMVATGDTGLPFRCLVFDGRYARDDPRCLLYGWPGDNASADAYRLGLEDRQQSRPTSQRVCWRPQRWQRGALLNCREFFCPWGFQEDAVFRVVYTTSSFVIWSTVFLAW